MKEYIISTNRLGLRNWLPSDEHPFIEMCKDAEVMRHFPKTLTEAETRQLIAVLSDHYKNYGYTYFAMEELATGEFIGFTGLKNQTWESEFTPCVDMGWRLKRAAWGKGYATEAANATVTAAFKMFDLKEVFAFATNTNIASTNIMKKIGMHHIGTVQHPAIIGDARFKHCEVYKITMQA